jgi:hypothetical protein
MPKNTEIGRKTNFKIYNKLKIVRMKSKPVVIPDLDSHNPKATGSNPVPATRKYRHLWLKTISAFLFSNLFPTKVARSR